MLKDLQNEKDNRNIFISNIGVCDYKLPISLVIENEVYNSICNISCNVALDETCRGAHLSRIITVLNNNIYGKTIRLEDFTNIIDETIKCSETIGASLGVDLDIILKRISPISEKESFITVNLKINDTVLSDCEDKSLSISMFGTTLCPCSKEISKYGAHNQRCKVIMTLFGDYESINFNEIVSTIERQFSANVYSTVKREDEKYITERAYENPKFSEDLIRDLLINVGDLYDGKICAELVNYESIHEHNVYAKGVINNRKVLRK